MNVSRRFGPANVLPASVLQVLLVLLRWWDRHGHAPAIKELMRELGWTSPWYVQSCLARLRAAGLVSRDGRTGRTLRPTCRWEGVKP